MKRYSGGHGCCSLQGPKLVDEPENDFTGEHHQHQRMQAEDLHFPRPKRDSGNL